MPVMNRWAWLLILICAGVTLGAPGEAPPALQSVEPGPVESAGPTSSEPSDLAITIRDLVAGLGSADFEEREAATDRLLELGSAAYDDLAEQYRACDDYEVRLRIEDIVTQAFFGEHLFEKNGFLGVALDVVGHGFDNRIAKGHTGVVVDRVIEHTAAHQVGVRQGDLIIAIDGERLPPDLDREGFSQLIREAGPGASMHLSVYRRERMHSFNVRLGARPLEYYDDSRHMRLLEETAREFDRWWTENFVADRSPQQRPPRGGGRSPKVEHVPTDDSGEL
jgi:hypothetical protein